MDDLARMTVEQLLGMIDALARCQNARPERDKRRAVFLASRILSNWPTRFIEVLNVEDERPKYCRKHIARIFSNLCGRGPGEQRGTEFMGSLIVEYALTRLGYHHPKLGNYANRLPTGFLEHSSVKRAFPLHKRGAIVDNVLKVDRDFPPRQQFGETSTLSVPEVLRSECEAASDLGCTRVAIRALVASGHLDGMLGRGGWMVTDASVNNFRGRYVFVHSIAKAENSRSERILRICRLRRIPVLWSKVEGPVKLQAFVKIADMPRLKLALADKRRVKLIPWRRVG
jgi:hypothetical protein